MIPPSPEGAACAADNLSPVSGRSLVLRMCAICLLLAALAGVSGCSTEEEYTNEPKPPRVFTVSTLITETAIAVSPRNFGAGPTRFVTGNKSDVTQTVTFEGERVSRSIDLGPGESRTFKVTTFPGPFEIDAGDTTADAVEMFIGPERETAQNDINQP